MWSMLHHLHGASDLPLLVVGEFNETMRSFDHFLANPTPTRQKNEFRDALEFCNLSDLGFTCAPFTYDNGRLGAANVHVRLDRAVADSNWRICSVMSECSTLLHPDLTTALF
jgi:hypothetical protein